jgi:hypothetical protein
MTGPAGTQENMMQTFATPAPITAVLTVPAGRIQPVAATT